MKNYRFVETCSKCKHMGMVIPSGNGKNMYCGHPSVTNTMGPNGKMHNVDSNRVCDNFDSIFCDGQYGVK
jgi:hypothetical protein